MPCRDYESDNESWELAQLKKQADRLARIACKALTELENNGVVEAILLRDDEVATWWGQHKEADRKAEEERKRKAEEARAKKAALAKLTPEERRLLGIK